MFIATLFTIAKIWKQLKCPSVDECIKQLWYIYMMEYYSTVKKKKTLLFTTVWVNLENIMLSEVSKLEKRQTPYDLTHIWDLMNKLN